MALTGLKFCNLKAVRIALNMLEGAQAVCPEGNTIMLSSKNGKDFQERN